MSNFANTFPALEGNVVTQGHVDYCLNNGHTRNAIIGKNGEIESIAERCPRCGDLLTAGDLRQRYESTAALPEKYQTAAHDSLKAALYAAWQVAAKRDEDKIKVAAARAEREATAEPSTADEAPIEYKVIGENTLTGNTWDCETGIKTRAEADKVRGGWARLESDYKIEYHVAVSLPEETARRISRGPLA